MRKRTGPLFMAAGIFIAGGPFVSHSHAQVSATWLAPGSGLWGVATNWSSNPLVPGLGGVATFATSTSSTSTITLNVSPTLAGVTFDSLQTYTVESAGTHVLNLAPTSLGDLPTLNVLSGTHVIAAPLAGSPSIRKTGPGTLVLSGNSTFTGNMAVSAGTLRVASSNALGPAGPNNAVGVQFGGVLELSGGISLGTRDLLLATSSASAPSGAIRSIAGSNTLGGSIFLAQSTSIGVDAGSTLRLGGEIIDNGLAGAGTLTKVGMGTLEVKRFGGVSSGAQQLPVGTLAIAAGTARVTAGGTAASASRVNNLTIDPGAVLDLQDNALVIDYSGASPLEQIRDYLSTGRLTATSVAGRRIGYAEASAIGIAATFSGQAVDATAIVAKAVLPGDADLSGAVGFTDLLRLAQNYQRPGSWSEGDFDHSGLIDFNDLLGLAQNYGSAALADGLATMEGEAGWSEDWALATALVPEPTLWGLMCGLIGPIAARSRKSCARE